MTKRNDNLERELRWLDPVEPDELEGAAESAAAAELLRRVTASGHAPTAGPSVLRRRRMPRLALSVAGVAALAAAILVLALGLPGGGGGENGLAASLDAAAATAASQPMPATDEPYTYLKTREMSVSTNAADRRSWRVLQSATREEWVTHDGAGRLRVVDGPARFIDAADRAEWEGAGEPTFLTLGFGRRTEDRFLDPGMLRGRVEELPTDPVALAERLRAKAEVEHGETPVAAATLQLIAEELRDPGASPAHRRALFEAAKEVPGIKYLGEQTDPAGRRGVAVGVTGLTAGAPTVYSMIFDPGTSRVLAAVATTPVSGVDGSPALLRARVYLESRGIGTLTGKEGEWLSGFDPAAAEGPVNSNLVYRMPMGAS